MNESEKGAYGHVLKYTGVFGGVQGLNVLVSLVRNKFVALLLGPSGMGLVSLFNTTVTFVSQATHFGISMSAVRHLSDYPDDDSHPQITHFVKVVRAWSLLTALLGMLVCIAIGPFLSNTTFAWGDHSLHFILLSPAVGMLAVTGGETAILKARRRLMSLAMVQVGSVLAALIMSVPVYYFFGEAGIVPVIVMMAFVTMVLTLRESYRLYPLQLRGAKGILGGLALNGGLGDYGKLITDSGYKSDFTAKYSGGSCLLNIGVYGLFILLYYNLIGATFTGTTMGAVFCMLCCCCNGATVLNVFPILLGYVVMGLLNKVGVTSFAVNAQAIVVGACFGSGLAPITGEYGLLAGFVAGILHYCLVTSVPGIHGGFNLYNGGFTAGIVCFVYVPILEHYFKSKSQRRMKA